MSKNYKDTLNLPKTDFPMKADLVKREPERLAKWESARLYEHIQASRKDADRFVLHDGPPFANGDVHMGTALNKVLKDIIVKSKTMAGFRAPFVPGWDCHGLPIEFKVVKESRGLSPLEVRQKSEAYARKYIDIQRRQFKRLGVFGEWENPYLTLSPGYEAEVIRAFAKFVELDLVYQGKKPVYWSTGAQTALAEAEVEYADRSDPAIFVKFPIVSGELAGKASMVIWTTTPWTLPANVAIALHPRHDYVVADFVRGSARAPRAVSDAPSGTPEPSGEAANRENGAAHVANESSAGAQTTAREARALPEQFIIASALIPAFTETTGYTLVVQGRSFRGEALAGIEAQHPFLERKSRVIVAEFVTMETGTGQVHIAPGHGSDDYIAGVENGLPILSPVDEQGRFTEEVGIPVWAGKYVFDANKDVIAHLRENGMLIGEQVHQHSYPHCWRSKTPIVFRAVEQFFIRIDKLREAALTAIDGVKWVPHWGRNRIYGTVESRPDWCISRQRSWGVPLPVFYDADGKAILNVEWINRVADLVEQYGTNAWFELDDAQIAEKLGLPEGTTRRNDTLDVWIDSGISHEAVLRKRMGVEKADVYIEATDQHRGWFQSSLMTSIAMHGTAPYKTCITHGFVVDVDGKKISKSSSYKKPMDAEHFVSKHGADIVRLWVSSVNFTDEVPFSEEMFTRLADTYRRIRNTLRILLANLYDFDVTKNAVVEFTMIDRWVLGRLQEVISTCREGYESYEFHKVYHALNQFCAVDLSSLYVDITKDRMYCDSADSPRRRATQTVMHAVFDALTRLLAPILVFTADEAREFFDDTNSVHAELFPEANTALIDPSLNQRVDGLLALRGTIGQAVEQARQEKLIGNALEGSVRLQIADEKMLNSVTGCEAELEEFFILSELSFVSGGETKAAITPTVNKKCDRCWRHRASVGASAEHPELCDRCERVVVEMTKSE